MGTTGLLGDTIYALSIDQHVLKRRSPEPSEYPHLPRARKDSLDSRFIKRATLPPNSMPSKAVASLGFKIVDLVGEDACLRLEQSFVRMVERELFAEH